MPFDVVAALTGLVKAYGLLGLFATSLIGSTIFVPFSVEAVLPLLVEVDINPYFIVIVASIGALLGTCVNYFLGYYGSDLMKKRLGEERISKAKGVMDKYGWPGLFIVIFTPVPLPIPVDPITIIPGIARMDLRRFTTVVLVAKLARYAFFVGVLEGLLRLLCLK